MEKILIKTYSKKELRLMYDIKEDTLRVWLNAIKGKIPYYNPNCKVLSPLQIKAIFEHYGEPKYMKIQ